MGTESPGSEGLIGLNHLDLRDHEVQMGTELPGPEGPMGTEIPRLEGL